jgi:hypothetical protein
MDRPNPRNHAKTIPPSGARGPRQGLGSLPILRAERSHHMRIWTASIGALILGILIGGVVAWNAHRITVTETRIVTKDVVPTACKGLQNGLDGLSNTTAVDADLKTVRRNMSFDASYRYYPSGNDFPDLQTLEDDVGRLENNWNYFQTTLVPDCTGIPWNGSVGGA